MNEFKNGVKNLELVPSSGGVFEVFLDGKQIFSKKELNRFPEKDEVIQMIQTRG